MEHLIERLEPSLLGPHLEPLKVRLRALAVGRRPFGRTGAPPHPRDPVRRAQARAAAFLAHRLGRAGAASGLKITYYNRTRNEETAREVSPQRLVYYRANWYLDAWCHLRNDIRSFGLDATREAEMVAGKVRGRVRLGARRRARERLRDFLGQEKVQWATLRFIPHRARYVALEQWHSKQRRPLGEGRHLRARGALQRRGRSW
jgi:hypothetical protein